MQAGLVNFRWEQLKYTATLEKAGDYILSPGEYIALTMEHLQSAFYFLLLGNVITLVSFLVELSCQYSQGTKLK
jgi:hypothetical protein